MRKDDSYTIKEPIKIRYKELQKGGSSIYLDCYITIVR